jgi:hypothetical protein
MARVIRFPQLEKPRDDVIAYCERLLCRARLGEVQGALTVISVAGGADEITICGVFADDLSYATSAARAGFDLLVGQKVCVDEASEEESRLRRRKGQ